MVAKRRLENNIITFHTEGVILIGHCSSGYCGGYCGQEQLNSNSRVAFDHQIVIIIIKIVFGCRNEKKMKKVKKKLKKKMKKK
jgi:hypothetical protein